MNTDVLIRIALELALGKPPARPDSPEEAQARLQLAKEQADIEARGGTVEIPFEIPSARPGDVP